MPEPENIDDAVEIRVEHVPDPNAPVINGGDGPRAETERTRPPQTARDTSQAERDRSSRRVEDEGDEDYGERVKRRLSQFRRRVGEAEAARDHLQTENRRLLGELRQSSEASLVHYEQAALARLDAAKREASEAYDSGDGQKVVEANRKLASAQVAVDNVESIKARRDLEKPTTQQEPDAPAPRQQQPRFSTRTQDWVNENPWFEEDPEAKAQALKIHDRLKREGFEIESPEYFDELTKRSRVLFPEHFEGEPAPASRRQRAEKTEEAEADDQQQEADPPARQHAPVAGVTRTPTKPNTAQSRVQSVKLTPAQVEAAQIAGITPKQYAENLVRLRGAGKVK